jgi:2-desacetyl-2-hydroxyethyl bacteriochlorophyllide A dehydrogenase
MGREFVLTAPGEFQFREYEDPVILGPTQVRLRALISGISHGTEMNIYRGVSAFHGQQFDRDLRLFVPGEPEELYPKTLGYEWVGEVVEVGDDVTRLAVGDLVHLDKSHRETWVVHEDENGLLALPAGVAPEEAICVALGYVALGAIHDGHIKLGDCVAVFGLGVIGLMVVQMAKLNGALQVFAVDPIEKRRELAADLGADVVLDPTACDAGLEIKRMTRRKGADIAFEASASYHALQAAIRSVQMGGTVVALAFYTAECTPLRLGEEWHHNRVTMYSSIGAWGCPHRDYPLWDRPRLADTVLELLADGKLQTAPFLTHRIPFEEAPSAYQLINDDPQAVVKVALTY